MNEQTNLKHIFLKKKYELAHATQSTQPNLGKQIKCNSFFTGLGAALQQPTIIGFKTESLTSHFLNRNEKRERERERERDSVNEL